MKTIFISYADNNFKLNRDKLLKSAESVGFDKVIGFSPESINKDDFWIKNRDILTQKRGAGYWLWKPYIILKELKKLKKNDILIYSDAGRTSYYEFKKFPKKIVNHMIKSEKGFLLGPALLQHGQLTKWVKRDCLTIMEADNHFYHNKPTIQGSPSFWSPTREAFEFLEKWIAYAEDEKCLTDLPNQLGKDNYKEFIDHRHDQSVLTLLAYKMDAPYLDYSNTLLFKILSLRPNSSLSHNFLKRIDDCEDMYDKKCILPTLVKSFYDIKKANNYE